MFCNAAPGAWHRFAFKQLHFLSQLLRFLAYHPFRKRNRIRCLNLFNSALIGNPKRKGHPRGRGAWYPFYAGYSEEFAYNFLRSLKLPKTAMILDPWNGSGTTTSTAARLGIRSLGIDLNPVMVIVAKARLLSNRSKASLVPLANHLVTQAVETEDEVPLSRWFIPRTANSIRSLEQAIRKTLIGDDQLLDGSETLEGVSDLAAFYYVALFSTVRLLLAPFRTSNPTWIKIPSAHQGRLRTLDTQVKIRFVQQVERMVSEISDSPPDLTDLDTDSIVKLCNAEDIVAKKNSVSLILTSPPYCTRIDYGALTYPELAVLGLDPCSTATSLRKSLTGTCAVNNRIDNPQPAWGTECLSILDDVACHPSKAASTYYLKQFLQYFTALYRSLKSLHPVLRTNAGLCMVLQDSYFKDIHVDLPLIVTEMCQSLGLSLRRTDKFSVKTPMSRSNLFHRKYVSEVRLVETVLCFQKD